MTLNPGIRIGPYEIVGQIGAGGMGVVYRARDSRLNRDVAIKVLPPAFAEDAERLRRFEQEARTTGSFNHPNILSVFDIGIHEGSPYLVMELLDGENLREKMGGKPLPIRKAVEIARAVAAGLGAAHEKGIIHRDIKPENVFLTKDGRVKVLDFGLAKQHTALPGKPQDDVLTKALAMGAQESEPGMVLGTVGYMSPEQVRGETLDGRSDVFSLGVMLWEMFTGIRPFHGASAVETMNAILKEEPPDLDLDLKVPPTLEKVLHSCLAKDPSGRFHSAHDLAFALETISGTSTGSKPVQKLTLLTSPNRKPIWIVASFLGVLLIGGIALLSRRPAAFTVELPMDRDMEIYAARSLPTGKGVILDARPAKGEARRLYTLAEGRLHAMPATEDSMLLEVFPDGSLLLGFDPVGKPRTTALLPPGGGKSTPAPVGVVWQFPWKTDGRHWRMRIGQDGDKGIVSRLFESFTMTKDEGIWKVRHSIPMSTPVTGGGLLGRYRMDTKGERLYWVELKVGQAYLSSLNREGRASSVLLSLPNGANECSIAFGPDGAMASIQTHDRRATVIGRLDLDSGRFKPIAELPGTFALADLTAEGAPLLLAVRNHPRLRWGKLASGEEREVPLIASEAFRGLSGDGSSILLGHYDGEGGRYLRWSEAEVLNLPQERILGLGLDGHSLLCATRKEGQETFMVRSLEGQGDDQFFGTWKSLVQASSTQDGKRFLVQGLLAGDEALGNRFTYLVNRDSSASSRPKRMPAELGTWVHPDGKRAFWIEQAGNSFEWGLYDLAANQRLTLPFSPPKDVRPLAETPDGKELLVERIGSPSEREILAIDVQSGKERTVRKLQVPATVRDFRDITLRVSPQGEFYAFSWAERIPGGLYQLKGLH